MLYGLLLEDLNAEAQRCEPLQTNKTAIDEEESWWLGMEAWVSNEFSPTS